MSCSAAVISEAICFDAPVLVCASAIVVLFVYAHHSPVERLFIPVPVCSFGASEHHRLLAWHAWPGVHGCLCKMPGRELSAFSSPCF